MMRLTVSLLALLPHYTQGHYTLHRSSCELFLVVRLHHGMQEGCFNMVIVGALVQFLLCCHCNSQSCYCSWCNVLVENRLSLAMRAKSIQLCHCSTMFRMLFSWGILVFHSILGSFQNIHTVCLCYHLQYGDALLVLELYQSRGLAWNCPVGKYIHSFSVLPAYVCKEYEWVIPLDCIMAWCMFIYGYIRCISVPLKPK